LVVLGCLLALACKRDEQHDLNRESVKTDAASLKPVASVSNAPASKVDFQDSAMGTNLHFVAYTTPSVPEAAVKSAMQAAVAEIRRLEALMSEWRNDSEVSELNRRAGEWTKLSPETFDVIAKGVEGGKLSQGTFDITFQVMSDIWKFGGAQEADPKLPTPAEINARKRFVNYKQIELDATAQRARIGKGQKIGLGGVAKGFIVDRAAQVMQKAGVRDFLVQAGGDLFGAGRKLDGSAWVSGIQDPRGPQGSFFASIELSDHAFSTAGDYARSYVKNGKRYHHIIDPRTGYPASACRSVTVWALDATTADVIDDAVFILGPKLGLELVERTAGAGVVIVDAHNKVWVSERLKDKVHIIKQPTDGV
jgi:thiamine biosynthesis lipoprotein